MFLEKKYKYKLENLKKEAAFLFDVFVNNFYPSKNSETYFVLIPFNKFRDKVNELLPNFKGQEDVFYDLLGFTPEDLDLVAYPEVIRFSEQFDATSNLKNWFVLLKVDVGSYLDVSVVSSLMTPQEIFIQNQSVDTMLEVLNKPCLLPMGADNSNLVSDLRNMTIVLDRMGVKHYGQGALSFSADGSIENLVSKTNIIFSTSLLIELLGFVRTEQPLIFDALKDDVIDFNKTPGVNRVLAMLDSGDGFAKMSSYYKDGTQKGFAACEKEAYRVCFSSLFNLQNMDISFFFLKLGFPLAHNDVNSSKKRIEDFLTEFSSGNEILYQNTAAFYFKNFPNEDDIAELKAMIGSMFLSRVESSPEIKNLDILPTNTDLSEKEWEENLKVSFVQYLGYRITSNSAKFNVADFSICVASIFKEDLMPEDLMAINNIKRYIDSEITFSEIRSFNLFMLLNVKSYRKINPYFYSLIFYNVKIDDYCFLLNDDLMGHFLSIYMQSFDNLKLDFAPILIKSCHFILKYNLFNHFTVIKAFSEFQPNLKCYSWIVLSAINHFKKFVEFEKLHLAEKALFVKQLEGSNAITKTTLFPIDVLKEFPLNKDVKFGHIYNEWIPNISLMLYTFQSAVMNYSRSPNCEEFKSASLISVDFTNFSNPKLKNGFGDNGYRFRVIHSCHNGKEEYSLFKVFNPTMIDLNNCTEIEKTLQYFLHFMWGKVGNYDVWQKIEENLEDIIEAKISNDNIEKIINDIVSNNYSESEEPENFKL